jgi:hypothetical protein
VFACINAVTIALVSRPEASPVTWSGEPLPSDCSVEPVEYWFELVEDVLELTDDVDMAVYL